MRILIVEDETYLAEAVAHVLKKDGYRVDLAHDGEEGLSQAISGIYDLIVLDFMLPKLDGISILKRLRSKHIDIPVIMLSARSEVEDKVLGLDSGADDYLAKPFKTAELLARIRALTRRESKPIKDELITIGNLSLDPGTFELRSPAKSFKLTAREFSLLKILADSRGSVVNKEFIFRKIWGNGQYTEDNYVEVYISFVRKKLKELGGHVSIDTVRGVGYKLHV